MGETKKDGWGDELMDDHITSLANHFFFSSLKKDSDAIEELSRNIARKNQDETCEFLCILGGIISGHNECSEKLYPELAKLNKKLTTSMKGFSNSKKRDLK